MRRPTFLLLAPLCVAAVAQQTDVINDEAKVPRYTLPAVLTLRSGQPAHDAKTWTGRRRPEILSIYESEVYGKSPAKPAKLNYEVRSVEKSALGGKAVRKIVTVFFSERPDAPKMDMLLYLPAGAKKPVPVILGLSFAGIHTVANDPGVPLAEQWVRDVKQPAPEKTRGASTTQWQVDKILAAGYGLATIYYGQIEPDFVGGMKHGIRPLFFKPGQTEPAPDEWGAIAAWGWGAMRAMDYLEKDKDVDARHVALFGHSRLGKAAIWAGAQDTRFSIVISNESGEGGAAISRRDYGERTKDLNTRFPHWFDGNFKRYSGREDEMPFDSHMLLSLIAPRGLYVASAEGDQWSDPKGEFLGAANASPVWELFGRKGIGTMEMPGLHQPVGDNVRYHIRAGKHDVTEYDWEQYLKFAAAQWGR
ncbi:MAG: putative acetyl xylan esterase [Candidatus Solibacter sp.]|nr:putative acetyl xylan esterase [Candidatus Solibacter sp.]